MTKGFGDSDKQASEKNPQYEFSLEMYTRFSAHLGQGKQRRGQAWMNALHDVDAELYDRIHSTEADCFYNDRKIDAFKEAVFGKGGN